MGCSGRTLRGQLVTPTPQSRAGARIGWIVVATTLGAIAGATLTPAGDPRAAPSFGCVFCGERALADVLVNVILFAPLGVGLALLGIRTRTALLAGAFVSALIELAQLVIPGRDPSIGDVIVNAGGTMTGMAFVGIVTELARMDDRVAARLSIAAACDVALAVLVTGWLLQPSFPRTAYWGQWTPNLGHLERYRGRVRSARIDGVEVRSRRIERSAWVREAVLGGGPVEVDFVAGPPVTRLASLLSVYDQDQREIFLLGPDRDDLVLRLRTRARGWRLDQPDLRASGAWPDLEPGTRDTVSALSPSRGEWCLEGPAERHCGLGFTVGAGWGILYYAEWFPGWLRVLLGAVWSAALLLATGFLIRRRWEALVAGGIVIVALAALPGTVGLRPTRGIEWAGAVLGLAVGMVWRSTIRFSPALNRGLDRGTPS